MVYTLKNSQLSVGISDLGAELVSVKSNISGCEYLWQGDEKIWSGQAPLLFPICGRLPDGKYLHDGNAYAMEHHGFARKTVFGAQQIGGTTLIFTLASNEETKQLYPFDFLFTVKYTLEENRLITELNIKNTGKSMLPATMGLHPGFNVPLGTGAGFEDYYLEFHEECSPDRFLFSERLLLSGIKTPFDLEDGRIIRLSHGIFEENDAIFLDRTSGRVTLKSDNNSRSVTVVYPDFRYIGFWQAAFCNAPYVCIEPWCGLPSLDGVSPELLQKADMYRLLPSREKSVRCDIIFG